MFAKPYARLYDLFNQNKPYKKEIDFIYRWAKKPNSVFDIGPGTGSYWHHYPKDVHILGVEKSLAMADQIESRGRIICSDIMNYKHRGMNYDCATALFHVMNYIPRHSFWKRLPIKKGGYFIFDILDKKKVEKDGFSETEKTVAGVYRRITPVRCNGKFVDLEIYIMEYADVDYTEKHRMYIYSHADIKRFCGKEFEIVEVKPTKNWTTWYKLRRK